MQGFEIIEHKGSGASLPADDNESRTAQPDTQGIATPFVNDHTDTAVTAPDAYSFDTDLGEDSDDSPVRGFVPQTRDIKKGYKKGGNFATSSSKTGGRGEPALKHFTRRAAQILDVSEREIPDILVNHPQKAFRVNPLRFDEAEPQSVHIHEVEAQLESDVIENLPLSWFDGAYLFDAADTSRVQDHPLTTEGKLYIQNPSSFLPVLALEPSSGKNILDMCSAPGGKTALIAALTRDIDVRLVANEPKGRRMQRLHQVLDILGVVETELISQDGRHLPNILGASSFDRILVDAECSTEAGINFESSNPVKDWSMDRVKRVSILQRQLLTAAYDMLEPGGVLIYSTCTLSPEENEGTVSSLVERRSDAVIQPLTFTAEQNGRTIRTWQGRTFSSEVAERCLRIFPSDYMEGFFVARIRKPTGDKSIDDSFEEPVSLDSVKPSS